MRTTIVIDDELLHQARAFTGLTKNRHWSAKA
jgi:Arc/MetJ family transcription regulator